MLKIIFIRRIKLRLCCNKTHTVEVEESSNHFLEWISVYSLPLAVAFFLGVVSVAVELNHIELKYKQLMTNNYVILVMQSIGNLQNDSLVPDVSVRNKTDESNTVRTK